MSKGVKVNADFLYPKSIGVIDMDINERGILLLLLFFKETDPNSGWNKTSLQTQERVFPLEIISFHSRVISS